MIPCHTPHICGVHSHKAGSEAAIRCGTPAAGFVPTGSLQVQPATQEVGPGEQRPLTESDLHDVDEELAGRLHEQRFRPSAAYHLSGKSGIQVMAADDRSSWAGEPTVNVHAFRGSEPQALNVNLVEVDENSGRVTLHTDSGQVEVDDADEVWYRDDSVPLQTPTTESHLYRDDRERALELVDDGFRATSAREVAGRSDFRMSVDGDDAEGISGVRDPGDGSLVATTYDGDDIHLDADDEVWYAEQPDDLE